MHDVDLFQQAFGLQEPWRVVDVQFDAEQRRLDLRIDFPKGSRFACPECGREGCEVHDTEEKTCRAPSAARRAPGRFACVTPAANRRPCG